ncbi:hypothetical protein PYW08_007727 [Mythimna loreyi]|uniref:Uncharacterized protein n=1 Tax=Mythimna loreyi TaxID=667449 RepID=A0ACC2QD50_9NEOP|nr:hypothetical protein PYW08_007727 [Mythimna loreyi]
MFSEVYAILALFCATALSAVVLPVHQEDAPLILTPFIKNGETENAKAMSAVDPSLFAGVNSHAGYFTVDDTRKWNLFFWYFPAQEVDLESTPLIIWLQGGPGWSSLIGLFNEIGPIKIVNNTVEKMPITWGSDYSLLFIENPVGTGFSFTEGEKYATNEDEIGASLLSFIQQFLSVFPELRKAPLFIAGESYAGKYIPAFGHYIHINQNESMPINLKGLAIGNGWIDPPTLLHTSEWAEQVGLLDPEQAKEVHEIEEQARRYWDEGNFNAYRQTAPNAFKKFKSYAPVNSNNFLLDHTENDKALEIFLNRADVQNALHVKKMEFKHNSNLVYFLLELDHYDTVKPWLEELLEHYGVMCYNGQLDVIVAYALSVHTYRSLNWSGAQAYRAAERTRLPHADDNTFSSFVKASGNFMDVMVRGAGHMVPADKPRAAKQIIDLFISKFK